MSIVLEKRNLKQDFMMSINQQAIVRKHLPMGTLGTAIYEEGGDQKFTNVKKRNRQYTISKDSERIAVQKATQALEPIGKDAHLYLLGSNDNETLAFAKAAHPFAKCTLMDIAEPELQKNRTRLKPHFDPETIETHVMDFQKDPLPESYNPNKVVILPSSNIGNTIGYYGQDPEDNIHINKQLTNLREQANYLILIYDTEQDPYKLKQQYGSKASEHFIRGAFQTVQTRLDVQRLDVRSLKLDSFWHPQSSAQLHSLVAQNEMNFSVEGQKRRLQKGDRAFPMHSYKFAPTQMEKIAKNNGWRLRQQVRQKHSSIVMQTFDNS